jgi:DNA-binding IclR family transcriptional regulator
MPDTSDKGVKSIRAVERAADVLLCFSRATPILSVTALERRLRLSRPTLYRLLHALEKKGLVRSFGEPQRFELDHRVVGLADAWAAKSDLSTAAARHLSELWRATDETVSLFVVALPTTKVCVQELPSRQPLVFTRGAGFTEATTTGASGKSILAFMGPAETEAALAGVADARTRLEIANELMRIRADGYCVSEGEIIAGAVAMAAPVFDRAGAVAGSICLFGPAARLSGAHRTACLASLRATAAHVSAALGHAAGARVAAE